MQISEKEFISDKTRWVSDVTPDASPVGRHRRVLLIQ